jgi:hypothetical protein
VLHPNQFQPNEAWILFQLNDTPIQTERDGAFNCVGLMDAASCFILGNEFVPIGRAEPSGAEARLLLQAAWEHEKKFPATLFVPSGQFGTFVSAEAERRGISVIAVPEAQLHVFTGEARQGFKEYIQGR